MKDFPRPVPVKVKIFGKEHVLHRLTYADIFELLGQVTDAAVMAQLQEASSAVVGMGVLAPLVGEVLKKSFPSFTAWDELPVDAATGLLSIVAEENDLVGIVENFSQLRNTTAPLAAQFRKD